MLLPQESDIERRIRERRAGLQPTQEATSAIEERIRQRRQEELGRAQFGVENPASTPDRAMRIIRLQNRTNGRFSEDFLDANLEDLEHEIVRQDFNMEKFLQESPTVGKWLSASDYAGSLDPEEVRKLGKVEYYLRRSKTQWPRPDNDLQAQARKNAHNRVERERIGGYVPLVSPKTGKPYPNQESARIANEVEPGAEEQYYQDELANLRAQEAFIGSDEPVGMAEAVGKRFRENPFFWAPYAGGAVDASRQGSILVDALALEANQATDEQKERVFQWRRMAEAEARRDPTFWAKAATTALESFPYALEFIGGTPAYSAVKGAILKGGKEAMEGFLKRMGRQVVSRALGVAVQTAMASPARITAEGLRRMAPHIALNADEEGQLHAVVTAQGDGFLKAFTKAAGSAYIDNLTEYFGKPVGKFMDGLKGALIGRYLAKFPKTKTSELLGRLTSAAGWDGMLGELFEERAGGALQDIVVEGKPVGQSVAGQIPTFLGGKLPVEQLAVEAMAFSPMILSGAIAPHVGPRLPDQANPEQLRRLGEAAKASKIVEENPQEAERLYREAVKGTPNESAYVDSDEFVDYFEQSAKDEQGRPLDPQAEAQKLGVTPEAYDQAVYFSGGDFVIPMEKMLVHGLRSQHANFYQETARTDPLQQSVKESMETAKQVETPAAETPEEATLRESSKRVFESVSQQLRAAGMSEAEAKVNALIEEMRVRTRAGLRGEDPFALSQRRMLEIRAEEGPPVPGEGGFEQPPVDDFQRSGSAADDFVLLNGHPAFGAVTPDMAKAIGMPEGSIVLLVGDHRFGLTKIDRKHGSLIKASGHSNAESFIADALRNVDAIYEYDRGANNVNMVSRVGKKLVGVTLQKSKRGNYYSVSTAFPITEGWFEGKRPLWERPAPGTPATSGPQPSVLPSGPASTGGPAGGSAGSTTAGEETVSHDQPGRKGPRGRTIPLRDRFLVKLFASKDRSTFLHEMGHIWLEEVREDVEFIQNLDAERQGTPERQKFMAGAEDLRKWLGLESWDQLTKEKSEKFARAIELYLMDGKVPSVELRSVFERVAKWLKAAYKRVTGYFSGIEITPEIRNFMDRLLVSEAEIAAAKSELEMQSRLAPPEAVQRVLQSAEEKLLGKLMETLKREDTEAYKEQKEKVRVEVAGEIDAMPVYQAMAGLRAGAPFRISTEAIKAFYGDEAKAKLKGRFAFMFSKDGVHPDTAAQQFGFSSGDELLTSIEAAEPREARIQREVEERMSERYPDLLRDPEALREEAVRSLHNEARSELLIEELQAIAKRTQARVPLLREIRKEAQAYIRGIPVSTLKPHLHQRAEMKAAHVARDAAAKGDLEAARAATIRELVNHERYRAAVEAKETFAKIEGYMADVQKPMRQARLGKLGDEWPAQMNTILHRFGFLGGEAPERSMTLEDWVESVEKQQGGERIAVAPAVLDETRRANYRDLSLDDLEGVYSTVKSIEYIARKIEDVEIRGEKVGKAIAIDQLAGRVQASIPQVKPLPETDKVYGQAELLWQMTKGFFDSNLRPEKIFERMDGGTSGIFHDLFWNPSVDAQVKRDDLRKKVLLPLQELVDKMPADRQARMNERVFIKSLGKSLTRRTLIGIALNAGNESNLAKMMGGGMWFGEEHVPLKEAQIQEMLDLLDEGDIQMVNTIWETIDQLYPEMNELNKRAVGLPLERIEAKPRQVRAGLLKGGYWPAVADARHSKVGEVQENSESLATDMFAPKYPKAATLHSAREKRTGAVYPIQFDWQRVLSSHVDKAITDIAYHEWIKQARRLLEAQPLKKAIQNRLGEHVYRSLEEWLVHQVRPIHGGYSANSAIERIQNGLVTNLTIAALGFRAATAMGNMLVAPVQASHQVRPDYLIRGLAKFYSNPKATLEAIHAASGEMRHRSEHLDQTFNQVLTALEGKRTLRSKIAWWAMAVHRWADQAMAPGIWWGKYQQEIDAGVEPEEAARLANKTIRTTQTAGAAKDLSSFERDPRYRIFKMFLGPMIIMQNEIRGAVAGKGAGALLDRKVWATLFATWLIPSVLFELAVGRGPDDDEDKKAWALRKILTYPAQMLPFVRDAGAGLEWLIAKVLERTGVGHGHPGPEVSRMNPIADVVGGLTKAARKAIDEDAEIDDKIEAGIRAAGPIFGVPSNQAVKTGGYLFDISKGETKPKNPLEFLWRTAVTGPNR